MNTKSEIISEFIIFAWIIMTGVVTAAGLSRSYENSKTLGKVVEVMEAQAQATRLIDFELRELKLKVEELEEKEN